MIAAALGVALAACAGGPPDRITTVAIAATPCDRPTARLGVGTVVADGLVLTAAHIVEDDLRGLEVDGQPARVVALDARTDGAVLALETADRATAQRRCRDVDVADAVRIVTPTDVISTTVLRIVTLSVDDTTDGVVHRRQHWCSTARCQPARVARRSSTSDGRIVGMVTISHTGRDVTYATRTGELQPLIDAAPTHGRDSVTRSSLAAQTPCA